MKSDGKGDIGMLVDYHMFILCSDLLSFNLVKYLLWYKYYLVVTIFLCLFANNSVGVYRIFEGFYIINSMC